MYVVQFNKRWMQVVNKILLVGSCFFSCFFTSTFLPLYSTVIKILCFMLIHLFAQILKILQSSIVLLSVLHQSRTLNKYLRLVSFCCVVLQIYISCFVKTWHFEEYLNVQVIYSVSDSTYSPCNICGGILMCIQHIHGLVCRNT